MQGRTALLTKGVSKIRIDQFVHPPAHVADVRSIGFGILDRESPAEIGALTSGIGWKIEPEACVRSARPQR